MFEIPEKAWIPLGAVTAALVAGVISLVNLVIAKDQKTTEFRQAWIDAVREAISQFAAHAVNSISVRNVTVPQAEAAHKKEETRKEAYSTLSEYFNAQQRPALELKNKILLYLNPKEHGLLIAQVNELYETTELSAKSDGVQVRQKADALLRGTQEVLKAEWERVKSGERFFKWIKYSLTAAILLPPILGGAYYWLLR